MYNIREFFGNWSPLAPSNVTRLIKRIIQNPLAILISGYNGSQGAFGKTQVRIVKRCFSFSSSRIAMRMPADDDINTNLSCPINQFVNMESGLSKDFSISVVGGSTVR